MSLKDSFRLKNPRRTLAMLVGLLLALSLLLSAAFVLAEMHHSCVGEQCEICHAVAQSVSYLKAESASVLPIALIVGFLFAVFFALFGEIQSKARADSLVTLKVKLSD